MARISIASIFAVLMSGQVAVPAYAAVDPICVSNCSTLTLVNVVNGGTATPADWALGATHNGDSYTFTSGDSKSVARNATYSVTSTGGPSGYSQSFVCTGNSNVTFDLAAQTVTFPNQSGRNATCTFTYSGPAIITVHAGGVRTGATTVSAMPNGAIFTATPVSGSPTGGPFTCTTTGGTGTCEIEVPSGFAWNISQSAVPSGYYANPSLDFGGSSTLTAETYEFRTGIVTSNIDVPGANPNSTYSDIRHPGNNNFSGLLSASLNNPAMSQKCGLDVALVLDQSGSMSGSKQTALKLAADDTITALTGTPSSLAIYTFSSVVGASVASTSTVSLASATPLHTFIDNLGTPSGSTNWDAGLHQVPAGFDLVIFLTDGAPTTYGNNAGVGNSTYFQYVDQGIFSANEIKSGGSTLIGVGIGLSGSTENLRAVSGATLNQDYYLASSASFGQILQDLAAGSCNNQLTIQKVIQDPTGTLLPNSALTNGWNFTNSISAGSTIDPSSTTAQVNDQNGFAGAAVSVPAGQTPTVSVTEDLNSQYTFVSAQCSVAGVSVETTMNGTTATFIGAPDVPMSCLFTNKQKPGQWKLSKSSSPTTGTTVNVGDSITYTLSASNPTDVLVLGAQATDDISDVLDDATLGVLPTGLTKVGSTLTWAIGNLTAGQTKTISYTVTVKSDAYDAIIKNVVTPGDSGSCEVLADCTTTHTTPKRATLTLVKSVNNGNTGGTKTSADWTLSADGGSTGSQIVDSATGVTHTVIPGSYSMSESAQWNGYTVEGTWVCTGQDPVTGRPESNVVVIVAGEDVTCTITNMAVLPSLTLNKVVINGDTGADQVATDWSLSAAGPTAVSDVSPGTKTFVASGAYTLSESGPSGFSASAWNCGSANVVGGVVTVELGQDIVCTITNTAIAPSLTLEKVVVNGTTGATHSAAEWSLSATGPTSITSVSTGTKSTAKIGNYTLSESGPSGYSASSWDCGSATLVGNVVSIPLGQDVVCSVTNTAIASSLTLVKSVDNGQTGSTQTVDDWTLSATGPTTISSVASGTKSTVEIGQYSLSEAGPDGYTASLWDCGDADVTSGVVTVALGEDVTCTVTNVAKDSSLTLIKVVDNGNTGAGFTFADWELSAAGPTAIDGVTSGTQTTVKIGDYVLSESGPIGFTSSDWACGDANVVNGVVTVELGQDVVCSITNTAVMSTLTLNKIVDNGTSGATYTPADWALSADGPTIVSSVLSGTESQVQIGQYTLSESGPDGYSASVWDCGNTSVVDGKISVALGQKIVCSVTNTAQSAALTLIKNVDNGETGATYVANDWSLSASGPSQVTDVASGTKSFVKVGDYTLSESGPDGYTASDWDCGTATLIDGVVTVGVGQEVTCEITNIAQSASLTLVKTVDNAQTGATAVAADWSLSANGPTTIPDVTSGTKSIVKVGDYTLSESGPTGYTASAWNCGDAPIREGVVTVGVGQQITCTVANTAQSSTLTLNKSVDNGTTGATNVASDWTLSASGPTAISQVSPGTQRVVQIGTYTLSESGPGGYTASTWVCNDAEIIDGTVSVELGEDIICTVTNTAVAPTLTLNKVVDKGQTGATHTASDWKLSASGPTAINQVASGTKTTVQVGTYSLSESGLDGYTASDWDCGNAAVVEGSVLVPVGQDISCTITNTAETSSLTLNKVVVNGDTGATHVSTDWSLSADGPTNVSGVLTGTKTTVQVGSYTLSELGASGYASSVWDCGSASVTSGVVVVGVGQDISCTITNTATTPLLTLKKIVDNGDTGAAGTPADWLLSASGPTAIEEVASGAVNPVKIGDYALSESGPDGYTASAWDCGEAEMQGDVVSMSLGDDVTCTVTNTAIAPTLTLNKSVENGETGATFTATDWSLSASGPTNITGVTSGTKSTVQVGSYTLSESGPDGYTASQWDCGDVPVVGNVVNVAPGQDVSCEIINTAIPATWTVNKTSDPATGSPVNPGEKITYTVTLTRTSGAMPTDVVVTDDLSSVLNHAAFGTIQVDSGEASLTETTLTWNAGAVSSSATLTYDVTVSEGAYGVTLSNVVTPPTGGSCVESCETENFTPHFLISKTSDPGNGVVLEPNQVVTYTMTARNDSQATVIGATAIDDMSQVLDKAALTLPLAQGLTMEPDGVTMTWAIPTLAPGQSTSVNYVITIDADAAGLDLINLVTPGDGGDCEISDEEVTPPELSPETGCDNSHYINAMDLTIIKKHTVPTGNSAVNGKSTSPITYELTVTNSGKLAGFDDALDVVVTDDIEDALEIDFDSIVAPDWDTSASTLGLFTAKYIGNSGILAPGASSTIVFTAVITRPIDFSEVTIPSLINIACVSTSGIEVSTENNCSQDSTPIEAVALDPEATCRNNILTMDYSIPLYGNPASPGSPITVALIWWTPGGYRDQDIDIDAMDTAALLANGALRVDYVTTPAGWKQGQLIEGFFYWPGVSFTSDGTILAYPGRYKSSDGRWVLNPSAPFYSIHSKAVVEVRITTSTTRVPVPITADPGCYPRAGQLAFTGVDGSHWQLISVIFSGLAIVGYLANRRRRIYEY